MIALDTNVLVRLLTGDDPAQAQRIAERLDGGGAFFVPITVALELEWVLRGAYGIAPEQVAAAMKALLSIRNLRFADEPAIVRALEHYRRGLDFADALHLEGAQGCDSMLSFDQNFRKRAQRNKLLPPVIEP